MAMENSLYETGVNTGVHFLCTSSGVPSVTMSLFELTLSKIYRMQWCLKTQSLKTLFSKYLGKNFLRIVQRKLRHCTVVIMTTLENYYVSSLSTIKTTWSYLVFSLISNFFRRIWFLLGHYLTCCSCFWYRRRYF